MFFRLKILIAKFIRGIEGIIYHACSLIEVNEYGKEELFKTST